MADSNATEVTICNQALQLLGASTITSLTDGTPTANACTLIYEETRDALLRLYVWKFAIKRVQITENATAPTFGRNHAYDLPGDYLAPLAPYPELDVENLDWIREGRQILTNDTSPLDLRYIAQITEVEDMDVLFREALSARMAVKLCESLTQSNSKLENVSAIYKGVIDEARKMSAFEAVNPLPPLDSWISARTSGYDNTKSWH